MGCSSSIARNFEDGDGQGRGTRQLPSSSPQVLLKATKEFAGQVHGPCASGLCVEGCEKWIGAALSEPKEPTKVYETKRSVLEFRTIFTPSAPTSGFKQLLSGAKGFAEFVSFLDTATGAWTISKVFLNDVLPAGQRLGAQAIAEHITCKHLHGIVEQKLQTGSSDLLPAQFPSSIRLKDVVNWNTYMLMTVAGSPDMSAKTVFGDRMVGAFQEELRASGMTFEQFKSFSMKEVFMRTALGKLVASIIDMWTTTASLDITISEVEVATSCGGYEHISGELRQAIDIRITLSHEEKLPVSTSLTKLDRQQTASTCASDFDM